MHKEEPDLVAKSPDESLVGESKEEVKGASSESSVAYDHDPGLHESLDKGDSEPSSSLVKDKTDEASSSDESVSSRSTPLESEAAESVASESVASEHSAVESGAAESGAKEAVAADASSLCSSHEFAETSSSSSLGECSKESLDASVSSASSESASSETNATVSTSTENSSDDKAKSISDTDAKADKHANEELIATGVGALEGFTFYNVKSDNKSTSEASATATSSDDIKDQASFTSEAKVSASEPASASAGASEHTSVSAGASEGLYSGASKGADAGSGASERADSGSGAGAADGAGADGVAGTSGSGRSDAGSGVKFLKYTLFYGQWFKEGEEIYMKDRSPDEVMKKPKGSIFLHVGLNLLWLIVVLIPISIVYLYANDRDDVRYEAIAELNENYDEQSIATPLLAVDFTAIISLVDNDDNITKKRKDGEVAYFTPQENHTSISIELKPVEYGPYTTYQYVAKVKSEGEINVNYALTRLINLDTVANIDYKTLRLILPIQSLKGITKVDSFKLNGVELNHYGSNNGYLALGGSYKRYGAVVGPVGNTINNESFSINKLWKYEVSYEIEGSSLLSLASYASNNKYEIKGTGPITPSLSGFAYNDVNMTSSPTSFDLKVKTSKAITSIMVDTDSDYDNDFYSPNGIVSFDAKNNLLSYIAYIAKLIIAVITILTLIMLALEIAYKRFLSVVQYALIDLTFALFLLMLLALGEHISFYAAYVTSALVVSIMISLYVKAACESKKSGILVFISLFACFSVLLSLINLEAYALLIGTAVLVFILSLIMYITRNINAVGKAKA